MGGWASDEGAGLLVGASGDADGFAPERVVERGGEALGVGGRHDAACGEEVEEALVVVLEAARDEVVGELREGEEHRVVRDGEVVGVEGGPEVAFVGGGTVAGLEPDGGEELVERDVRDVPGGELGALREVGEEVLADAVVVPLVPGVHGVAQVGGAVVTLVVADLGAVVLGVVRAVGAVGVLGVHGAPARHPG